MSMLYDRVLAEGTEPMIFFPLPTNVVEHRNAMVNLLAAQLTIDDGLRDFKKVTPEIEERYHSAAEELYETGMADGYRFRVSDDFLAERTSNIQLASGELPEAVVIDGTNIYDWLVATGARTVGEGLEEFAGTPVMPPSPQTWVEMRIDPRHPEGLDDRIFEHGLVRTGFFVQVVDMRDQPQAEVVPDARWSIFMNGFFEDARGRVSGPEIGGVMLLDGNGHMVMHDRMPMIQTWRPGIDFSTGSGIESMDRAVLEDQAGMIRTLQPLLATLAFANAKNVKRRTVEPPPKLSRKWRRKRGKGRELIRYHVLEIGPLSRTLETEGGAREHGVARAMHICRGHFRTYTENAPLFGRVVGTVWVPPHVRGSEKAGLVGKDYRVVRELER